MKVADIKNYTRQKEVRIVKVKPGHTTTYFSDALTVASFKRALLKQAYYLMVKENNTFYLCIYFPHVIGQVLWMTIMPEGCKAV